MVSFSRYMATGQGASEMAHQATTEDINAIVHLKPPFSGHKSGILRDVQPHPSETGMTVYSIDFGDGRAEALIDWDVKVLDEGESYEDVFGVPSTPETANPLKGGPVRRGNRKADRDSAAPKVAKAPVGPAVLGPNGEVPAGYNLSVLGTGKLTKSNFFPGEDATAKSMLLKVQRGMMKRSELPPSLVAFVQGNEKWNRQFGNALDLTDKFYEDTQAAVAAQKEEERKRAEAQRAAQKQQAQNVEGAAEKAEA